MEKKTRVQRGEKHILPHEADVEHKVFVRFLGRMLEERLCKKYLCRNDSFFSNHLTF